MRQHYNGGWRASWVCTAMHCDGSEAPLHCVRSTLPGSEVDDYTESTCSDNPAPCTRISYRVQSMLGGRRGKFRTISRSPG